MSVTEDALRAQDEKLTEMGANDEVKALTKAVYSGVSDLSSDQKQLLIHDAVGMLHRTLTGIASDPRDAASDAFVAVGVAALAGYANELLREEAGATSTGDRQVDAVFENFRQLIKASTVANMSEEDKALADGFVERVNARVEAGEDAQAAYEDERATLAATLQARQAGAPAAAQAESGDREFYGQYL